MKENWSIIFSTIITVMLFFLSSLPIISSLEPAEKFDYIDDGNNVIAEYYFNEGSGSTTRDDSGRGKTGFLTPEVNWNDGKWFMYNALEFNLNNPMFPNYVHINHDSDFNLENIDSWCIYANILIPSGSNEDFYPIISKTSYSYQTEPPYYLQYCAGYSFYLDSLGELCFKLHDYPGGSQHFTLVDGDGADLRDGLWHFVAVSYVDGCYSLYVDPTSLSNGLVEVGFYEGTPKDNTNDVYIGRYDRTDGYQTNTYYLKGAIDDLHIYELSDYLPWGDRNIAYYTFDENDNTDPKYINDRCSWNFENRGTLNQASFTQQGKKGETGLLLQNMISSNNCYGQIPDYDDILDLTDDNFYISTWIKCQEDNGMRQTIIKKMDTSSQFNGYHLYLDYYGSGLLVKFDMWNGYTCSCIHGDTIINFNQWYKIIVRSIGNSVYLYVEDEAGLVIEDEKENYLDRPGATTSYIYIGNNEPSGTQREGFNGIIDDLIIGGYKSNYIHIPMDMDYQVVNDRYIPVNGGGGDYSTPEHVGTTPYGKAYEFMKDADTDRHDRLLVEFLPFSILRDEIFSMEIMIFPYDIGVDPNYNGMVIVEYGFWRLYINDDKYVCFDVYSDDDEVTQIYTVTSNQKITENVWTSISVDYNQLEFKLYINGIYQNEEYVDTGSPYNYYPDSDSASSMYIGTGSVYYYDDTELKTHGGLGFNGYLDEFIYYSNKIEHDYAEANHRSQWNIEYCTMKPTYDLPTLLLDFDEGSGYETTDNSPFGNSAILGNKFVNRADNDENTVDNTYKIYIKNGDPGFPWGDWISADSTVTTVGGTNKGQTKDIVALNWGSEYRYISVGQSNEYDEEIDKSTVYYIQENNPSWSDNGLYGRCLDFNTNDPIQYMFVKIKDDDTLDPGVTRDTGDEFSPTTFSIKFWIKPSTTDEGVIISKWGGNQPTQGNVQVEGQYWIELNSGVIRVFVVEEVWDEPSQKYIGISRMMESSGNVYVDEWTNVQFTLFNGYGYIFINGELDTCVDLDVYGIYSSEYDDEDIYIGFNEALPSPNQPQFSGLIDQLEYYNSYVDPGIIIQHFDFENIVSNGVDDSSIFDNDATTSGVTIDSNGKYSNCIKFDGIDDYLTGHSDFPSSYTVETWANLDQKEQCISVFPYKSPDHITYPVIFKVENDGRISIQYSDQEFLELGYRIVYSTNQIEWNKWTHIAYSININEEHSSTTNRNSISIFIDGLWDSTHQVITPDSISADPSYQTDTYYIGKCPANIWSSQFQPDYLDGYIDEFIITNGAKDFREDMDGDDMSDSYEILRSTNSDQYNPVEHNYRIALMVSPWFSDSELQYPYDITQMRYYLMSNDWKDEDIIFLNIILEMEEWTPPEWIDKDWRDGEPRIDCLGYVCDALRFGGPAALYDRDTEKQDFRDDSFHSLPKLTQNDLLYVELRDHGVGYKDNPLDNGDGSGYEVDYGWRGGRCQSVINEGSSVIDDEEEDDRGDLKESEFVIDIGRYFPTYNEMTVNDSDPNVYTDTETPYYDFCQHNKMYIELDLDGNEWKEEIYLVKEYSDNIWEKDGTKYWFRLYVDGYGFEDRPNRPIGKGGDKMWDSQCLAYDPSPPISGWVTKARFEGVDFNQDDLSDDFGWNTFNLDYIDDEYIDDWIDVDEGFVTYDILNDDQAIPDMNSNEDVDSSHQIPQFDMLHIWFDDWVFENLSQIESKDLLLLCDFCYSGGFVDDLEPLASMIMSSNRETDRSSRYNVMFYGRIRGDNCAIYIDSTGEVLEDRDNTAYTPGRYNDPSITADGARGQIDNPSTSYNDDRNIKWDSVSSYESEIGLFDDVVSFNEAMYFTNAVLADYYDVHDINDKYSGTAYWKHDPPMYMKDDSSRQVFM